MNEYRFAKLVGEWRESNDMRGLSDIDRIEKSLNLQSAILSWYLPGKPRSYFRSTCSKKARYLHTHWLPVLHPILDGCFYKRGVTSLRFMDVNRSDCAMGLTRQTTIGLLSTIEAIQLRREARAMEQLTPLSDRQLCSDDIECYFSLCHSSLGSHFTLKR